MSRRLLQAAPSAPSDTVMPRARISATGAMPDPSFRFEPGQCSTLTSCSASSRLLARRPPRRSAPRTGAARRDRWPPGTRCCRTPVRFWTIAISSRDSDACVCTSSPRSARQARRPLRAARASTRRRSAARTRRAGGRSCAPCQRVGSARLSSIDVLRVFLQPRRHSAVDVHHALADRRAQPALGDRLEHHVGVVHRLHRQHRGGAAAQQLGRRPGARPRGARRGVCAASIGQTRVRSQSISAQVVGVAAEQRLAQMDVRLDEAGQHVDRRARR